MSKDKEKDAKPAAAAPAGDAKPAKKGLPIKTIAVVAVVMIVEAVAVVGVFKMITPKSSHAADHAKIESNDGDMLKELKVVDEKYQNMKNNESWVWQVVVTAQVKKKHADKVEAIFKARESEIKDGLRQIVGNAEHAQLKEADSRTLNRQFTAFLNKMVGIDEKTNDPYIEKILIPKCLGFSSSF